MSPSFIKQALNNAQETLESFISDETNLQKMEKAIDAFVATIKNDGRLLSCGNGGSMCDSMHFVEELTGRFRKDRDPICATTPA